MTTFLSPRPMLGKFAPMMAALVLAIGIPNLIVEAAPPAPGTDGFLIWF